MSLDDEKPDYAGDAMAFIAYTATAMYNGQILLFLSGVLLSLCQ